MQVMATVTDLPHGLVDSSSTTTRGAPVALDIERNLLGAILLNPENFSAAQELLTAADFFDPKHQLIFKAMQKLYESGSSVSLELVNNELSNSTSNVDLAYPSTLIDGLPHNASLPELATILKDKTARREAMRLGQKITDTASSSGDWQIHVDQLQEVVDVSVPESITSSITSLFDLLNADVPERVCLLEPIVREKDLVEVFAKTGVGKTWFSLSMAIAAATATDFFDWSVPKAVPVLYVDGEMAFEDLQRRTQWLLVGATRNSQIDTNDVQLDFMCRDHKMKYALDNDRGRSRFLREVTQQQYKLVVIDNISCLMSTANENDASAWNENLQFLLKLRRRGVAVVLIHHAGKDGKSRGTSRRHDTLDLVLRLKNPKDYDHQDGCRFKLSFEKARGLTGADKFPIEAQLHVSPVDGVMQATWEIIETSNAKKDRCIELLKQGTKADDVAEELDVHRTTVYRWQKAARKEGILK
jgi:replicative DNA helicase